MLNHCWSSWLCSFLFGKRCLDKLRVHGWFKGRFKSSGRRVSSCHNTMSKLLHGADLWPKIKEARVLSAISKFVCIGPYQVFLKRLRWKWEDLFKNSQKCSLIFFSGWRILHLLSSKAVTTQSSLIGLVSKCLESKIQLELWALRLFVLFERKYVIYMFWSGWRIRLLVGCKFKLFEQDYIICY